MKEASIIALALALAAQAGGCGGDSKPGATPPKAGAKADGAKADGAEAGAKADGEDKPETPPPSCVVAVNEFLWSVEVHDGTAVRDALVGECVDNGWTASERRCVAAARDPEQLGKCEVRSTVAIVLGNSGADLGIAECEVLARYRRCVIPTKLQPIRQDTEEALAESLAIWRADLAKPGGPKRIQELCSKMADALERTFSRQDCDDDKK